MSRANLDPMAPALLYTVAQTVLNEQGNAVISAWSEADLNSPNLDKTAAEHALQNYRARRHLMPAGVTWLSDTREAREYTYVRSKQQPRPVYLPGFELAEALDAAWFAGAMRPVARTGLNSIRLIKDCEQWVERNKDRLSRKNEVELYEMFMTESKAALSDDQAPSGSENDRDFHHPIRIWKPLIDAFATGVGFFWNGREEIVLVLRPRLWLVDRRLHREDGPAVVWDNGEEHYFWNGIEVPDWVIRSPASITGELIEAEPDSRRRAAMTERLRAWHFNPTPLQG
jgi:hypothetical protein